MPDETKQGEAIMFYGWAARRRAIHKDVLLRLVGQDRAAKTGGRKVRPCELDHKPGTTACTCKSTLVCMSLNREGPDA